MKNTKSKTLNSIELKIWKTILSFALENFRTPTREEIARLISDEKNKYSPQLVQYWLKSLEKKGYIEIVPLRVGAFVIKGRKKSVKSKNNEQ